jgi:hypothetical protein
VFTILLHKINIISLFRYEIRIHMNKTSLAISAVVIVAATAMGFFGFIATTQSAAAQSFFNTNNSASQSATQTGTATGGPGGVAVGGSANGGDASVQQSICQQAAQSGAFGSSSNTIENC